MSYMDIQITPDKMFVLFHILFCKLSSSTEVSTKINANANKENKEDSTMHIITKAKSSPPYKNTNKKFINSLTSKKGPKFTVIGGQKVDLNSEKPQYLKLTLEQIQELAMQQRSGIFRIDI